MRSESEWPPLCPPSEADLARWLAVDVMPDPVDVCARRPGPTGRRCRGKGYFNPHPTLARRQWVKSIPETMLAVSLTAIVVTSLLHATRSCSGVGLTCSGAD